MPTRRPIAGATGSGTVLIVEDDPALREVLELVFKVDGYTTATATHGREALALATQRAIRPDIVIADYNLPGGLTGIQVMLGLREVLRREIPVIILTGDISTDTLREIARHGCIQLNKPVKAEELTQLVGSILAQRAHAAASGIAAAATDRRLGTAGRSSSSMTMRGCAIRCASCSRRKAASSRSTRAARRFWPPIAAVAPGASSSTPACRE